MAVTIKGFASDWSVPEPAKTALGQSFAAKDVVAGLSTRTVVAEQRETVAVGRPLYPVSPAITWHDAQPVVNGARVAHGTTGVAADVRVVGGYAVQPGDANGTRVYNGVNGNDLALLSIEFDFVGTEFAIELRQRNAGSTVHLEVDGQRVTERPQGIVGAGDSGAGIRYYRVKFLNSQPRRIRAHISIADLRGIWKLPEATLTPPTYPVAPVKVAALGDSWTGGALSSGPTDTWAAHFARALNVEVANCGQGGSGYVADPENININPFGAAERLDALGTWSPSYVVVFGSINDQYMDPTAVATAATNVYAGIASRLPSAKVIVVGPQWNAGTAPAHFKAVSDAVLAAAGSAPNVVQVIDPLAQNLITGTGRSTLLKGDGNADQFIGSDNVHPTRTGHQYIGYWAAGQMVRAIKGDNA